MAVRFDADGKDYTRALALGSQSAYTVSFWMKISVDRNAFTCPLSLDNGTGDVAYFETKSDGTTIQVWDEGNYSANGFGDRALTVGTWYFCCLAVNGASATYYSADEDDATLASSAVANYSATTNIANIRLGESPFGGEWLNGAMCAVKLWTAALSAAEVEQERRSYRPVRTENLRAWYPLDRAGTTDYSGNAQTLSGGSGVTTEDGPAINWGYDRTWVDIPPAAGGQIVAVGLASETDSAQAFARTKLRVVGLSSETDSALALGRAHARALGLATETDTGQPVARTKIRAVGLAAETETALPIGRRKLRSVGLTSESDAAQPLGRVRTRTLGMAAESDAAQAFGRIEFKAVGQATETDAAQPLGRVELQALGLASETDAGRPISRTKSRLIGTAAEVDEALPFGHPGAHILGIAAETDQALPIGRLKRRSVGLASESDTALVLVRNHGRTVGIAIETDTATAWGRRKTRVVGQAQELDQALPIGHPGGSVRREFWGMVV